MTIYSEKMLISNRCRLGFISNSHKKSWTVSYFRVSCCPAKSSSSNNGMGQVLISTTASGDHNMVNRVNGTTRNLSGVSSRYINSETGVNETIVWRTIKWATTHHMVSRISRKEKRRNQCELFMTWFHQFWNKNPNIQIIWLSRNYLRYWPS